jgi:hypothetical protein
MPAMVELTDAEMLLKEAEWTQQDIRDLRDRSNAMMTAYVVATYALFAWVVGKALEGGPAAAVNVDAQIWGLRSRVDVALAICAIPMVNALFVTIQLEIATKSMWMRHHLASIARDLGSARWTWGEDVDQSPTVLMASGGFVLVALVAGGALMCGGLWFVHPAIHRSGIAKTFWYLAVASLVVATVATFVVAVFAPTRIGAEIQSRRRG